MYLDKFADIDKAMKNKLTETFGINFIPGPIIVQKDSGIQDLLSGEENPLEVGNYQLIHSLAKWKRNVINKYDYHGVLTDTHALRTSEIQDIYHDIYVDQWDWEFRISEANQRILEETVESIWRILYEIGKFYKPDIPHDLTLFYASQLKESLPNLTPKQREYEVVKKCGAIFIQGINCYTHETRSPDYDDWNLNGDILVYDNINDNVLEISSMGIRVNGKKAEKQIDEFGLGDNFKNQKFVKDLINNNLPLTIGGGIGKSRFVMYLLGLKSIHELRD